jgi:peptidoglycan/LPS O-acetylase OafA/YrhL
MEMLGYALVLVFGLLIAFGVSRLVLFALLAGMFVADGMLKATFEYHGGGGSLLLIPIGSTVSFLVPFVIGMVLRTYRHRVPLHPVVALVLFGAWIALNQTPVSRYALAVAASYGAITLAMHWPVWLERATPLVYGSYGTYIWAFPIQQLIIMAGVRNLGVLIALAVPAAYLVGQLSWRYVEEPTQRLRRHLRPPSAERTVVLSAAAMSSAPRIPSGRGAG